MVIWETLRRYERITTSDKAWEAFILMLRISAQTFVKETGDSDLSSSDRTDENITLSSVLMISPSCWQHLSLLQVPSTSAHNDHQIFGSGCLSCGNMYCFFVLAISRGMVQVEQHGSRTFVCQQASTTALFFNGENWRKIQPHTVFHRARPLYRPLWVIWPRNSATNFNPYSSLSRYTVCSLYERQYTWLQHIHRIQSDLDGMGDLSIN